MTDRLALRRILRSILGLSRRIDKSSIEEIRKLVNEISTTILEIDLALSRGARIYAATIYENDHISATVFGMSRAGGRIPLHDHQGNYGFIRVLRGRLRIRSFSWLDEDVERRLANNNEQGLRPTVYEGEQILTPHDSVAMLSPLKGNVHEVIADSDNTAFFDLLIPGYSDELPCLFYRLSDKSKDTQTGDVCWLKQIPMPQDYCTDHLPYPCISYLT